jgi:peptidoglycan/LPS O-acetylase OafA/YrhL
MDAVPPVASRHLPALDGLRLLAFPLIAPLGWNAQLCWTLAAIVAAAVASRISYVIIERPAMRLVRRIAQTSPRREQRDVSAYLR